MTYNEALNKLHRWADEPKFASREEIEVLQTIDKALVLASKVEILYHNFAGDDLEKCVKYGNKDAKQQGRSYSTMMMYEIADEFRDLLDLDVEYDTTEFTPREIEAMKQGKVISHRPRR